MEVSNVTGSFESYAKALVAVQIPPVGAEVLPAPWKGCQTQVLLRLRSQAEAQAAGGGTAPHHQRNGTAPQGCYDAVFAQLSRFPRSGEAAANQRPLTSVCREDGRPFHGQVLEHLQGGVHAVKNLGPVSERSISIVHAALDTTKNTKLYLTLSTHRGPSSPWFIRIKLMAVSTPHLPADLSSGT